MILCLLLLIMVESARTIYGRPIPGKDVNYPISDWVSFWSHNGLRLATYRFPSEAPKGICIFLHGVISHSGLFAGMAESFSKANFEVFAFDLIGHGRSEGDRALISDFNGAVQDCINYIELVRQNFSSELPIFLIGASLGATICL